MKIKMNASFLAACLCSLPLVERAGAVETIPETATPSVIVPTDQEPVTPGKFQPTWESLGQYQTPDWFRDAKFGIWIIYGPQCQPEQGDWYARGMYLQGGAQYKFSLANYGPQSQFGFKDVIHLWKATHWDPDKLVALYQSAGAQYVCAMANHHDNFDLYDSKYQPWNSVKIGPMIDVIGDVAKAAHAHNMRFGATVHAAHAWLFYEDAQGADKTGPLAGVPYDGKMTKADGRGKWWDGLDPQDLYAQNHKPSTGFDTANAINNEWDYKNGASIPDAAYCEKFYNRTIDLLHKYNPDLVYFDDDALPLWPVSDAGLKIAADFYNHNMQSHNGNLQAVVLGKMLDEFQRKCMVWDIERGSSNHIEPLPFETDTCIGDWHYSRPLYDHGYHKDAKTVIRTLADVVSKNGNLLLNIPVRGDGSIDDKEVAILQKIGDWMKVNRECIFATRPWKVFGEGPTAEGPQLAAKGFNETKVRPYSSADVRFTTKDGAVYAILLGTPTNTVTLKSFGSAAGLFPRPIGSVSLLGYDGKLKWTQSPSGLKIELPTVDLSNIAVVFKIAP